MWDVNERAITNRIGDSRYGITTRSISLEAVSSKAKSVKHLGLTFTESSGTCDLMKRAQSIVTSFEPLAVNCLFTNQMPKRMLNAWQRISIIESNHVARNRVPQIKIIGGRSAWEIAEIRDKIATEYYEWIRMSTNDVSNIAKNLNLPEFKVQRVKDHIFYKTHRLDYGKGMSRFDPDFKIVEAWKRLESGTHGKADLLFFKHEYFESRFEGIFKTDYKTAHNTAVRAGYPSGLQNDDLIQEIKNGIINRH